MDDITLAMASLGKNLPNIYLILSMIGMVYFAVVFWRMDKNELNPKSLRAAFGLSATGLAFVSWMGMALSFHYRIETPERLLWTTIIGTLTSVTGLFLKYVATPKEHWDKAKCHVCRNLSAWIGLLAVNLVVVAWPLLF